MNGVSNVLARIELMSLKGAFDIKEIRDLVHYEFDRATSSDVRVELIKIFLTVMESVERNSENVEAATQIAVLRHSDYLFLLNKEAMVGDYICSEELAKITAREVAAGRLSPNDEFRKLAISGAAVGVATRAECIALTKRDRSRKKAASFWGRIFGV